MPNIRTIGSYRLFFFSDESKEPPHVHVERQNALAKFWISPVRLAKSKDFGSVELNKIQRIVSENVEEIRRKWDEHFNG